MQQWTGVASPVWEKLLYNVCTDFSVIFQLSRVHHSKQRLHCRGVIIPTPLVVFSERSLYRARIAFLWGATAISKIDTRFFISSLIDLKFGRPLEGNNTQNRTDFDFWISFPEKFGAPLNFAFALRPIGQKNSNRLYSSFKSCFELIFSGVLGWRCESLLWDFREWE